MSLSVPDTPNPLKRQIGRFASVGVLNTVLGVSLVFLCFEVFGLGLTLSNAIGYGAGLALSFALNGTWTFGAKSFDAGALAKFLALVAVAFVANLSVIQALMPLGVPYPLAQIAGVVTYSALVFLGMKYAIFKS
ncbi:GtrA-like protein [Boseongicola aestuarii]|uniref:GtrA-like protein n=1 Tax=Boseongicola aestuarii TaxID=1470561 RepID=A0A238J3D1_9RHOB|nr:GtrA-like protein [Boseongicola aestuarii]